MAKREVSDIDARYFRHKCQLTTKFASLRGMTLVVCVEVGSESGAPS